MKGKIKMFQAIAVMVGYIIGVGMFGLPFVVAQAGIWPFIFFISFFGLVQLFQHMIYANMVLATPSFHRLPGYAEIYLGKAARNFLAFTKIGGNYGALLAYIIITGIFLNELLSPIFGGTEFIYSSLLFAVSAAIVFSGIRAVAKSELIMSVFLILVVSFIAYKGYGAVEIPNFSAVNWTYLLLPFGATIMALDGNGSIPIVAKILNRDAAAVKKAVFIGTLLPIFITLVFTLIVVGISGPNTTPDALVGIKSVLNNGVVMLALIFGVLSMTTSTILVSEAIKETLAWDFKVKERLALVLAMGVPYLMFLLGFRNLTEVISLAGGVAGSLSAIMLILIFNRIKKLPGKLVLFKWNPPTGLLFVITIIFLAGMFYELGNFLSNY